MKTVKIILVNLCRLALALTFVFSGFVKAIDPQGTQYKLQDYLTALSLQGFVPDAVTLLAAVALAAIELTMGIMILFAIERRRISKFVVAFMAVMTLITVWIFFANPVKDCGCFGDAIHLTNGQTLAKNIVLMACALIVVRWPLLMPRLISKTNQWIITNYTLLYILATSAWCLWDLPTFDFRPYHLGANILKGMTIPKGAPQPKFTTTFILEKHGVKKEFTLDNYPDSTWTFIDSKTVQTAPGYVPPIHDFSIEDQQGNDITQQALHHKGYTFLLIMPHLEQADQSQFGDINEIYDYAVDHHYPFYCLTASDEKARQKWEDMTGAEYPFYTCDETTLKTIVRSNPGLVLLKDATVIGKWSHNRLPKEIMSDKPLNELSIGQLNPDSVAKRVTEIFLWYVLPLFLLSLVDRIIVNIKRRKDIFVSHKNNRTMRKKIVAGNWKMNMNLQDGVALAKEINAACAADKPNCGVIVCTPFIHLASVAQVLDQNVVALGAENCADKAKGAYTGEVSAEMVKSTGAQYVILGHSERRQYYHETPEILKEKVQLALANGLKVIFCCGETLEEREANKQNEVVKAELDGSVFNLSADEWKNIVLAYEPIWAIGTGKTATSDQAEEMLAYIRSIVAEKYGKQAAEDTTILYGGSCKPGNAKELFAKPDIDGGLIGGASLKAADFKAIIDAWK
ncbi:BT_3928 family protein [Prevotella sp. AGR2160]|uniref:BT_3928 family protein n=1 Tax=Prevotella sp. AGR2160 TaxID=1280674 RepID=UPI000400A6DA|nr:BT_3928 family protein [Prevotella sp. AGR2160]